MTDFVHLHNHTDYSLLDGAMKIDDMVAKTKALGMTSAGLISQIVLSNAPAIITGILFGILVSQPAGSKLCMLIFSIFEMKSMDFNLPFIWIAITAVVILVSAVATSGILGMRVRTLKPVEMITED